MKTNSRYLIAALSLLLALAMAGAGLAESYTSDIMRLLRFEGEVSITDKEGNDRFVMENVRFASGETLTTGTSSTASVSLDTDRIVALNAETIVGFLQEANRMEMTLKQGELFLDVSNKLDENESLDIRTTTLTVGIRGTIVYVGTTRRGNAESRSCLMVLEGTAEASFDEQTVPVPAGSILFVPGLNKNESMTMRSIEKDDISDFVRTQAVQEEVYERIITELPGLESLLNHDPYAADGDWTFDGEVLLIAQSASKLYDGSPLTRNDDVLVSGLPDGFTCSASADGTITDAGETENPISEYSIFNQSGEDVTSHFTNVSTVPGRLVVDPCPLTVWTGTARKFYDGTRLTCNKAGISLLPVQNDENPVRNLALPQSEQNGAVALYGISGTVLVHGTNPLSRDTAEIPLPVGSKLTVQLNSDASDNISYVIEKLTEDSLPEEILRIFAADPDLLDEACISAGWDKKLIEDRIAQLSDAASPETDELIQDMANVRINVDTDITNYSGRPLTGEEAHFSPVLLDESITVTATGFRLMVGDSDNTYNIDWGTANPSNYVICESLGILTVYAAPPVAESEPEHVHTAGYPEIYITEAKCTSPGGYTEVVTCTGCGEILTETHNSTSALGHLWSAWTQSRAATCTTSGQEKRTCERCGAEETQDTAASGHSWGNWSQTKAPTCTESGIETRTCSGCSAQETRETPASGHTPVTDAAVTATCQRPGLTEGSHCSVCGTVIVAQTEVTVNHTPGNPSQEERQVATCTVPGSYEEVVRCTVCGAEISRQTIATPALGHSGGEASCTKLAVCDICGESYGALGDHQLELLDPAFEPTCTDPGFTASYRCVVCDKIIGGDEIPALGHEYNEDGYCIRCGEEKP